MAQEVGDAVLRFLGDSSDLDTKLDDVGPKTKTAFDGAADSVEEGTGRMKASMFEAQGEARLLGEAFGVHLPRHVSTFIAKLPGVGEALQAAFSATAILFVANAIVEVSKKLTAFIADHLIFTESMKESNKAIAENNVALLEQAANYDKAKTAIEHFGAGGTDAIRLQLAAMRQQITTTKESLTTGEQQNQTQRVITNEYITQNGYLAKGYDIVKSWITGGKTQLDTIKAQTGAIQNKVVLDYASLKALQEQEALLEKQLETEKALENIRQQKEVKTTSLSAQRAQAEAAVALDSQTAEKRQAIKEHFEDMQYKLEVSSTRQQLAILKQNDENTKDAQAKLYAELQAMAFKHEAVISERLQKAKDELLKNLEDISKSIPQSAPTLDIITPKAVQNMLNGIKVAHDLGLTLRQDLVQAIKDAQKALDEFAQSGIKDPVVFKQLQANLVTAEKALENFGKQQDKFKGKTDNTWRGFQQDLKNGAQAMQNLSQMGKEAFDSMASGLQGAIQSAILAQGSFSQALEKATASALASLASQALVKALFYTAEGFAALAGFEETSAGQYFAAAGEMAAVGAAAGLAAHAMSGMGGGNNNTQQTQNSQSNTGQTNRTVGATVGVQHFATGGLISAPTLAIMGEESKKEAVLPLEDPRAMAKIGQAISAGGGGGGVHFHLPHGSVISADVLGHLASKLSKAVAGGKVTLLASNSLRLTKRSA